MSAPWQPGHFGPGQPLNTPAPQYPVFVATSEPGPPESTTPSGATAIIAAVFRCMNGDFLSSFMSTTNVASGFAMCQVDRRSVASRASVRARRSMPASMSAHISRAPNEAAIFSTKNLMSNTGPNS